jgi:tetratricopeptide (TPR) repeat protein
MDIVYTTLAFGEARNFLRCRSHNSEPPPASEPQDILRGADRCQVTTSMARFSMARIQFYCCSLCINGLLAVLSPAQVSSKAAAPDASSPAEQGIRLAAKGRCGQALPILKRAATHLADKQLKYRAVMSTARCAMSLNQTETAVEALLVLNREFPRDLDVLYTTTHFYSALASRAAQELAATAPTSHQAEQLEAEAFESQENWDRAIAEYKKILDQEPKAEGIHYRIGRIFLSKSPADAEGAKAEFNEEVKIDPENASAEFMLGEIARQAGQWDEAIGHFSRASERDEGFQEAYLALGMSLNSAGKFSDAITPLRSYVKMQPGDPAGHYQLATAYARTGQKPEAEREMALQREAAAKSPRDAQPPK